MLVSKVFGFAHVEGFLAFHEGVLPFHEGIFLEKFGRTFLPWNRQVHWIHGTQLPVQVWCFLHSWLRYRCIFPPKYRNVPLLILQHPLTLKTFVHECCRHLPLCYYTVYRFMVLVTYPPPQKLILVSPFPFLPHPFAVPVKSEHKVIHPHFAFLQFCVIVFWSWYFFIQLVLILYDLPLAYFLPSPFLHQYSRSYFV